MRLLEFQAKRIFAEHGIPVPSSRLLRSPLDVAGLPLPAVLKAQVPVGGRGKAGGIQIAEEEKEVKAIIEELLSSDIRGHSVQAALAEEKTEVVREIYLAVLFDKRANLPMVMAGAAGGIDIEEVARQSPEQIVSKHIDPFIGLQSYTVRHVAKAVGIDDLTGFGAILERMCAILKTYDATLVEINPLAETPNGLVALDAKMVLDDKAAYRHPELFAGLREERKELDKTERTRAEQLATERDITYVLLDGDVGLIADGAGTGMLTLDLIQDAGGHAANFCEMGGLADAEIMRQSIEVVLANPRVKALLITLIGGLTRMDEMADGIIQYLKQNEASVPMVIRMCGTREEVGKATLQEVGIDTFDDLTEAVRGVVALAGGNSNGNID
jgi:succinyl-CoA synthetase beta subunit